MSIAVHVPDILPMIVPVSINCCIEAVRPNPDPAAVIMARAASSEVPGLNELL